MLSVKRSARKTSLRNIDQYFCFKRLKTKGRCPPFIFVLVNGAPELVLNVDRADQLASFAVVWAFVQDFRVFVKDFLVVLGSATHLSGIRRRNANNNEIFLA